MDLLQKFAFYSEKEIVAKDLLSGEKQLVINDIFPQANDTTVKFLAYSHFIVEIGHPYSGLVALKVERYTDSVQFKSKEINIQLPQQLIIPKFIALYDEVFNLCNIAHCESIYYKQTKTEFVLKQFHMQYNCIGWALGIYHWLMPIENIATNNLLALEKITKNFIIAMDNMYSTLKKKPLVIFDVIDKLDLNTVFCTQDVPDNHQIEIDGAVAFYFKGDIMTHAARYIESFYGVEINRWSSKLGHLPMIAHDLEDLIGESRGYGRPLCYVLPKTLAEVNEL